MKNIIRRISIFFLLVLGGLIFSELIYIYLGKLPHYPPLKVTVSCVLWCSGVTTQAGQALHYIISIFIALSIFTVWQLIHSLRTKKYHRLLFFSILETFLIVATFFIISPIPPSNEKDCQTRLAYPWQFKEQCFYYLAQTQQNINLCNAINDEYVKNYCVFKLAQKIEDYKLCLLAKESPTIERGSLNTASAYKWYSKEWCLQYLIDSLIGKSPPSKETCLLFTDIGDWTKNYCLEHSKK